MSKDMAARLAKALAKKAKAKDKAAKTAAKAEIEVIEKERAVSTHALTAELEALTKLESRVTILGHVQRGGIPSPADRVLASRLGTAAARLIHEECYGVMVAVRGTESVPVPLEEVVGKRKNVPLDHSWIRTARDLGVSFGDEV
jgi:6-phosphofructokinase 1